MDHQLGIGELGEAGLQVGGLDAGVHVALPHPHLQLASRLALHVGREEHVGEEEDLPVRGDRLHDLDGIGGGAAVVGLRLHLGGGVDVGDDDGAGVLLLPGPELGRGDAVRQGAPGIHVGDEHGAVGRKDLGGLRHEVHAAEDDDLRVGGGRPARQLEGVAGEVGHLLDPGHLVGVGEDHRVAFGSQRAHLSRLSPVAEFWNLRLCRRHGV